MNTNENVEDTLLNRVLEDSFNNYDNNTNNTLSSDDINNFIKSCNLIKQYNIGLTCIICFDDDIYERKYIYLKCCNNKQIICYDCFIETLKKHGTECPCCKNNMIDEIKKIKSSKNKFKNKLNNNKFKSEKINDLMYQYIDNIEELKYKKYNIYTINNTLLISYNNYNNIEYVLDEKFKENKKVFDLFYNYSKYMDKLLSCVKKGKFNINLPKFIIDEYLDNKYNKEDRIKNIIKYEKHIWNEILFIFNFNYKNTKNIIINFKKIFEKYEIKI